MPIIVFDIKERKPPKVIKGEYEGTIIRGLMNKEIVDDLEDKAEKTLATFEKELSKLRTGTALLRFLRT